MTPETVCYHCNGTKVMRWDGSLIGCDVCGGTGRIPAQESETARHAPVKASGVCSAHQYPEVGGRNYDPFCLVCWPDPPSAGEGELDKLPGRLRLSMANLEIAVKDAGDVVRAREVLAAAINAYIARRVLEELERMRRIVIANEEVLGVMGLGYLEDIDQRIAVIKKEGKGE